MSAAVKTNEGPLLRVCAWCSPQRLIGANDKATRPLTAHEKATCPLTHGICLDCSDRL